VTQYTDFTTAICHRELQHRHKFNLIYAHKKSEDFTVFPTSFHKNFQRST